jgi:hypothetical protein
MSMNSMFSTRDDLVLHIRAKLCEIGAVAGDADYQILIAFWISLCRPKRSRIHYVYLQFLPSRMNMGIFANTSYKALARRSAECSPSVSL